MHSGETLTCLHYLNSHMMDFCSAARSRTTGVILKIFKNMEDIPFRKKKTYRLKYGDTIGTYVSTGSHSKTSN